jgi:hypothetical protein
MGFKDLVTSAPPLQEFGMLARVIQPIMTDPKETREVKRNTLCGLVDNLSEKTFNNKIVVNQIMKIINMKEDICKEYPDALAQMNGILSWLPRMIKHIDMIKKEVVKARKSYGLKV